MKRIAQIIITSIIIVNVAIAENTTSQCTCNKPDSQIVEIVAIQASGLDAQTEIIKTLKAELKQIRDELELLKDELDVLRGQKKAVTVNPPIQQVKQPLIESETNNVVNINTAGLKELMTLPGIGTVKANRIINHRTVQGPFNTVDEITKVSGIGKQTLTMIRHLITVN